MDNQDYEVPQVMSKAGLTRGKTSWLLPAALAASFLVSCSQLSLPDAPSLESRLARIVDDAEQDYLPPSLQVVVQRGRETLVHERRGVALEEQPIYRIASISKVVTSLATLATIDRGLMDLEAPVSEYLPELGAPTDASSCEVGDTLAACGTEVSGRLTIRHLLTNTAGIPYPRPSGSFVERLYSVRGITNGAQRTVYSVQGLVARLNPLVLSASPGKKFVYGLSIDLLGAILERVHGRPLEEVLRALVLQPLAMTETGFRVEPGSATRLVPLHEVVSGSARSLPHSADLLEGYGYIFDTSYPTDPQHRYESAGGGLVSTARDLVQLASYLASGETSTGVPVVAEETRQTMMEDHLGGVSTEIPGIGYGLGIGVSLRDRDDSGVRSAFWSGLFHTHIWVYPDHGVSLVFASQVRPDQRGSLHNRLAKEVEAFLIDSRNSLR